jgi:hypothetical protein
MTVMMPGSSSLLADAPMLLLLLLLVVVSTAIWGHCLRYQSDSCWLTCVSMWGAAVGYC